MLQQIIRGPGYYGYIKVSAFYFDFAQITVVVIIDSFLLINMLNKATGKNVQYV